MKGEGRKKARAMVGEPVPFSQYTVRYRAVGYRADGWRVVECGTFNMPGDRPRLKQLIPTAVWEWVRMNFIRRTGVFSAKCVALDLLRGAIAAPIGRVRNVRRKHFPPKKGRRMKDEVGRMK